MPNSEVQSDLRRAKFLAWWDRYDAIFLVVGTVLCGMVIGGYAMSFYDREERMALLRRHDDDIRQFRMDCRKTVDQESQKVLEATGAATNAAKAVADLTESAAADDDAPTPKRSQPAPAKPPVKRAPPVNLEEAVSRANAQIKEGRK